MTQDTKQKSYRGVKCLRCYQPIAISPRVVVLEVELQDYQTTHLKCRKCQVFNLRCVWCGIEKPYLVGEILDFRGIPAEATPL
jgi:hypothetical protein